LLLVCEKIVYWSEILCNLWIMYINLLIWYTLFYRHHLFLKLVLHVQRNRILTIKCIHFVLGKIVLLNDFNMSRKFNFQHFLHSLIVKLNFNWYLVQYGYRLTSHAKTSYQIFERVIVITLSGLFFTVFSFIKKT
jgi:hypothetical protein